MFLNSIKLLKVDHYLKGNLVDQRLEQRLEELKQELRHEDGGQGPDNHILGLLSLLSYTRANKDTKVLEIGSHKGVSTEVFAILCSSIDTIDPLLDNNIYLANNLRLSTYAYVKLYRDYSYNILPKLTKQSYDIAYIDGDHGYGSVHIDIKHSLPLLKPEGFLCGHDHRMPEVRRAISDYYTGPIVVFEDDSWAIPRKEINV